MNISIRENIHLGDKLVSLLLAYNIYLAEKVKINLTCCSLLASSINHLGMQHAFNVTVGKIYAANKSISDLIPQLSGTNLIFLNQKILTTKNNYKVAKIELPQIEVATNNTTTFQVDARSFNSCKKEIPMAQLQKFILKHSRYPLIGIGGPDTKKYKNFNYQLGDLCSSIGHIKRCNQFVGVDSGMSHIAGILNKKSDIIITYSNLKDVNDIMAFYNFFYPNVKCFPRQEIKIF